MQVLAQGGGRHRGAGCRCGGHNHDAAGIQAGFLHLVRRSRRRRCPRDVVRGAMHVRGCGDRGGRRRRQCHGNRADGTPGPAAACVARLHVIAVAAIATAAGAPAHGAVGLHGGPATAIDLLLQGVTGCVGDAIPARRRLTSSVPVSPPDFVSIHRHRFYFIGSINVKASDENMKNINEITPKKSKREALLA